MLTIQEASKLYDDICHKIVEIKFMQQEIYDMATRMFEELYTLKYKENVNSCEHKNIIATNPEGCVDCGKIF